MADDTPAYDIGSIRKLLLAAFEADELRRFCQDRPLFQPIVERFGPGQGLDDMVAEAIDYCETYHLFDELLAQIKEANPRQYEHFESRLTISTAALAEIPCPYRGLEVFDVQHAANYFGRKEMIRKLLDRLQETNFVTVVGPSGCGKSSLVRAGMVTALREGALPGSEAWQIEIYRPGDDPLRALALPLAQILVPDASPVDRLAEARKLADHLRTRTLSIGDVLAQIRDQRPASGIAEKDLPRLMLVGDQFEETFTLCGDEALRHLFLETLIQAVKTPWVTVVLTLRADFFGRVLEDESFGRFVDTGLVNVLPMSREERREAVEQPALRAGRRFEEGLVERILDAVEGSPGDLPLLEFALTELWERQTATGQLTHQAYESIGEVRGAIAHRADAAFTHLSADEQRVVRAIFTRLVRVARPDEGAEDSRQRTALAQLQPEAQALVKILADTRLLVTGRDPASGEEIVEVAHEALIRGWQPLQEWLNHDREFLLWRQRVSTLARIWQDSGRGEGALLRDVMLQEARVRSADRLGELSDLERAYLEESEAAAGRAEAARIAARERELAQARALRQRNRFLVVALVLAALAAVIAGTFFFREREAGYAASTAEAVALTSEAAAQNAATAEATQALLAETARQTAVVAAAAEAQARQSAEAAAKAEAQSRQEAEEQARAARQALSSQLAVQGQAVLEDYPQRSLLLAAEAVSITMRAEDPPTRAAQDTLRQALANAGGRGLSGHEGPVSVVAISPDKHWLATGSADHTVRLWNLDTLDPVPIILEGHDDAITTAVINSDSHWLATGGADGLVRLWNLGEVDPSTHSIALPGHTKSIEALAISTNGHWLATGSEDATVRLWDLQARDPAATPIELAGQNGKISSLILSRDSRWLFAASADGTVHRWDVAARDPASTATILQASTADIRAMAVSPNGRWLVTGGVDKTARVWDLDAEDPDAEPIVLTDHNAAITTVAISPDSHWLVTGGADSKAILWDLTKSDLKTASFALSGHEGEITAVAFSPDQPDSRWLVTCSADRTARLWDLGSPNPGVTSIVLRGHDGPLTAVAISADSAWLVTGSQDWTARLWNLANPRPAAAPLSLPGHETLIDAVSISADGHWLVTGGRDNTLRLWDLTATDPAAGSIHVLSGHMAGVTAATVSQDSHWLASGSWDGQVRLWDLTAPDPNATSSILSGHQDKIAAIAISPDSHWLATGSWDHTVRLWDLQDLSAASSVLAGHDAAITTIAISPDSHWLVTGGTDSTARLWDLTRSGLKTASFILSGHNGDITATAFSHDGRWLVTGSWDTTVRRWDLSAADPASSSLLFPDHLDRVTALAISPDDRWLVTASADKTARLWDLAAPDPTARPIILAGHQDAVMAVAISSDSKRLATGSGDHTIRLWDLTAEDPTARPLILVGHAQPIASVAFSPDQPDSRWLVSSSWDRTVRLWDLKLSELVELACRTAGRNLSSAEWQQYFGDEPYRIICSNLPGPVEIRAGETLTATSKAESSPSAPPTTASEKVPPEKDRCPAIAPGLMQVRIAFVSNRDGNNEIYVMDGNGQNMRRLTFDAGDDLNPLWLPGNDRILFSSNRSGKVRLYTMRTDGSGAETFELQVPSDAQKPSLSPDSRQLAYALGASGSWTININGHQIATSDAAEPFLAWSPDGSQLALEGRWEDGQRTISVIDTNRYTLTKVTGEAYAAWNATWMPDGERIAFASDMDGDPEIYTIRPDGSDLAQLTSNAKQDMFPGWSPDGHWLAFFSDRDDTIAIYRMAADGTSPLRLFTVPEPNKPWELGLGWSPDNQWLCYYLGQEGQRDIYRASVLGGNSCRLTFDPTDDWSPSWQRPGKG